MATIKKFEELVAFKKARELVKETYKSFQSCRDGGFRDQIQRASVSVLSNIAEGFESGTKQEFLNYLYIAKASAGEVRAQTYAALYIGYLNIETFQYLNNLDEQSSRLIASFIEKLKSGGMMGLQNKAGVSKGESHLQEIMDKAGVVMTPEGVKKRADLSEEQKKKWDII